MTNFEPDNRIFVKNSMMVCLHKVGISKYMPSHCSDTDRPLGYLRMHKNAMVSINALEFPSYLADGRVCTYVIQEAHLTTGRGGVVICYYFLHLLHRRNRVDIQHPLAASMAHQHLPVPRTVMVHLHHPAADLTKSTLRVQM